MWTNPRRFQRVCPLLQRGPDGWRCSVGPEDVRPFWIRAGVSYGALLGACYLILSTALFLGLRSRGTEGLAWADVAWPGRWENIRTARARYFIAQGAGAFAQKDYRGAILSAQTAAQIDPHDYEIAALLAKFQEQTLGPGGAEAAYNWLVGRFPAQKLRSSLAFRDTLLARGKLDQLAAFSVRMMIEMPAVSSFWLRSTIEALRLSGGAGAVLQRQVGELMRLDSTAQNLLRAAELIEQGRGREARVILGRPLEQRGDPIYPLIQIEQFIRLDDWAGAMQARNRALPVLGGYNAMALQYWIEQRAGNEDFARLCFLKTLSVPLDSTRVEWLAAMLIRAPDATCFAALDAAAFRQAMSLSRSDGAALWVAALVCKDRDAAARWAAFLGADGTLSVPDYVDVDFTAIDWTDPRSAQFLMSFLPLPREVVHALGARIEPRSSRRD